MIDAGTNVGIPFNGSAPDLGAFESNYTLPVTLLSLSASTEQKNVVLRWVTGTEINNRGWDVERLISGTSEWQKIAFVQGAGNSTTKHDYSFTDKNAGTGTIQYRIKQVDFDGAYKYSPVVRVKLNNTNTSGLTIYPNPVIDKTSVAFSLAEQANIQMFIYNSSGQRVKAIFSETLNAGNYYRFVEINDLPEGFYTLQVLTNGVASSYKLIKIQ
jgi:trimeric autotransporter adhesin